MTWKNSCYSWFSSRKVDEESVSHLYWDAFTKRSAIFRWRIVTLSICTHALINSLVVRIHLITWRPLGPLGPSTRDWWKKQISILLKFALKSYSKGNLPGCINVGQLFTVWCQYAVKGFFSGADEHCSFNSFHPQYGSIESMQACLLLCLLQCCDGIRITAFFVPIYKESCDVLQ